MLQGVAPIFPVTDLARSGGLYRELGFEVEEHADATYAIARWDGVEIHLALVDHLDQMSNTSAAYLFVDDAEALARRWEGVPDATVTSPVATDYGLLEGALLDPDRNLIRFGSPI